MKDFHRSLEAFFSPRYVTHAQINALHKFGASGAITGNHQGISLPAPGDCYSFWHLAYIEHLDILSEAEEEIRFKSNCLFVLQVTWGRIGEMALGY